MAEAHSAPTVVFSMAKRGCIQSQNDTRNCLGKILVRSPPIPAKAPCDQTPSYGSPFIAANPFSKHANSLLPQLSNSRPSGSWRHTPCAITPPAPSIWPYPARLAELTLTISKTSRAPDLLEPEPLLLDHRQTPSIS